MDINKYDNQGLRGHQTEGSTAQTNGQVWFVNGNHGSAGNTADTGVGESWDLPFATINYAVSRCSNDAGDIIYVAPGHTEAIQDTSPLNQSGTVTDELCVDKTGVTIVGMGTGTNRPTITLSGATDATVEVRAGDVTLRNLLIVNNLANTVAMVQVNALADGLILENCEFRDSGAALECVLQINLATAADDITIRGCRFFNTAANDGNTACVFSIGATARLKIYDNLFRGDWQAPVIDLDAAVSTDTEVVDNLFNQLDAVVTSVIDLHGSTTGVVKGNHIHCPAGGSQVPITAAAVLVSDNWWSPNEGVDTQPILGSGGAGGSSLMKHFYVDSGTGVATNDGLSWATPLSLVDDAIGKCTGSNGDIVHVAAGHAEADMDGTAGQIFDVDVIGVTIIGEGSGDARPTFTFTTDATNGLVDVTVADCVLENLIFKCNIASQENMIKLSSSADDTVIRNCEFLEGGATPLTCIMLGGGDGQADNVLIEGCRFYMPTDGNQDNAVEVLFDMAGLVIKNNYILVNSDEAVIEFPAGGNASQDIRITGNTIINEQSGIHCIEIEQTALTVTGIIADNILVSTSRAAALQPNITNCYGNVWMAVGGSVRPVLLEGGDLTTPGQNVYVNSAHAQAVDDAAHGTSWDFPLTTIEYANTNVVTANNNDVIHVGPGHEETISDSLFLDFDSAGVTVIGYGNGEDKPMVTFDHASAVVDVGAASVTIKNFLFRASVDGVAVGVDILAGFNHCRIIDCEFGEPEAGTDEFAIALQVNAVCDFTEISGCQFHAGAQAGVTAIKLTGANAFLNMHDNWVTGAYSGPPILGSGAAITDCDIYNNRIATSGGQDTFNLVAASTGFVRDNRIVVGAVTFAADLDIGNCWSMNNYMIADDDVGGAKCDHRYVAAASVTETADG